MPNRRTALTGVSVMLLAAATAAVSQGSAHAADRAPLASRGINYLNTQVNLPAGVWTDTPLQVTLRRAGTYELDADVRGRLAGAGPLNTYIVARLWDVTDNTELPQSERLVYQVIAPIPTAAPSYGGNQTAPISELITVDGPTTIRLQALHRDAVGGAAIAQIYSDGEGYTSLRYDRVGP
jgi:hypothetical protein